MFTSGITWPKYFAWDLWPSYEPKPWMILVLTQIEHYCHNSNMMSTIVRKWHQHHVLGPKSSIGPQIRQTAPIWHLHLHLKSDPDFKVLMLAYLIEHFGKIKGSIYCYLCLTLFFKESSFGIWWTRSHRHKAEILDQGGAFSFKSQVSSSLTGRDTTCDNLFSDFPSVRLGVYNLRPWEHYTS